MSVFLENPVLLKEVRSRLRARRQSKASRFAAFAVVGMIVLLLYYFGIRGILHSSSQGAVDIYDLFVVGIEMTFVLFLVPSLSAGSITQEREQQTWNALLMSRLTASQIVIGKFISALLPASVLLVLFFPLNLLAAYVGNMPAASVLLSHGLLLGQALFLTALCLFFSWAFRRTYVATAASFSAIAFLIVGTYILLLLWSIAVGSTRTVREEEFVPLWLNPYRSIYFALDLPNRQFLPAVFDLIFCFVGTVILLSVVTRRLGRGPKEMEQ